MTRCRHSGTREHESADEWQLESGMTMVYILLAKQRAWCVLNILNPCAKDINLHITLIFLLCATEQDFNRMSDTQKLMNTSTFLSVKG